VSHSTWVTICVTSIVFAIVMLYLGICIRLKERYVMHTDITGVRRGDVMVDETGIYRVKSVHAPDEIICTKEDQ